MGQSIIRRDTILTSVENMCEQLKEGDKSVTQVMSEYLILTDMDEATEEQVNKLVRETFETLEHKDIITIQQNIALYAVNRPIEIVNFYQWINTRLQKIITGEYTLIEFKQAWDKAYAGIEQKIHDNKTETADKLRMLNIVMMVNDMMEG